MVGMIHQLVLFGTQVRPPVGNTLAAVLCLPAIVGEGRI